MLYHSVMKALSIFALSAVSLFGQTNLIIEREAEFSRPRTGRNLDMALVLLLGLLAVFITPAMGEKKPLDWENVHKIGNRKITGSVQYFNPSQECRIGRELANQVERRAKMVEDEVISEYVSRIANNLVKNSDWKDNHFYVKTIEDSSTNAFALPCGFFYVNTGLIDFVENEAELAGVLGHEIAHIAGRHGTRKLSKAMMWQQIGAAAAGAVAASTKNWRLGHSIANLSSAMGQLVFLKFGRDFERKADWLGIQYMYKAGYDPSVMLAFFERIAAKNKKSKRKVTPFLSSHPMEKGRVRDISRRMPFLPGKGEYALSNNEFENIKNRVKNLSGRNCKEEESWNSTTNDVDVTIVCSQTVNTEQAQ